jgi:hypothetical protein
MRTIKILVITFVLTTLAGLILFKVADLLPVPGPGEDFEGIYTENEGAEENFDINFKKLTGIVKPLGVSIYKEGTHRLESDNSLIALLESKDFDLDEYEHKEVELEGIIRDAIEDGLTIMSISKVNVIDDLIEDLNILDEIGYNFHFEYPSSWEYTKGVGKLIFYKLNDEKEIPLITVLQHPNVDVPIEAWLDTLEEEISFREIHIKVGDEPGYRKTGRDGDGTEIVKSYVKDETNDAIYEIRYIGNNQTVKTHYLNIVDEFRIGAIEVEIEEEEERVVPVKPELEEEGTNKEEASIEEVPESEQVLVAEPEPEPEPESEPEPEPQQESNLDPVIKKSESKNTSTQTAGGTGDNVSPFTPLSEDDISKGVQGGYKLFAGNSLSYEFPKNWVHGFISSGYYMMTDWSTYKADGQELVQDHARIFILIGEQDQECTYSKSKDLSGTEYTVCALQSGLTAIVDRVAESLSK